MALGDVIRVSAGILIPNPRMLHLTNFDPTAPDWIPDTWEKILPGAGGTFEVRTTSGFDDHRAMRINSIPGAGGFNEVRSGPSYPGQIPVFELPTQQLALRIRFAFRKSAIQQSFEPYLIVYNRDESNSKILSGYTVHSALGSVWAVYQSSVAFDLSVQTLAGAPNNWIDPRVDHVRLYLKFGGSATQCVFAFDSFTINWNFLDPGNATTTYSTLTMPSGPEELLFVPGSGVRFDETGFGGIRGVDPTGGAARWRMNLRYSAATPADVKIWDAAWHLNRGLLSRDSIGIGTLAAPPTIAPLVIEPFLADPPLFSMGKRPENLYMFWTEGQNWTPRKIIGGVQKGDVSLQEVG